ncbi:hypothetical protein GCM10011381_00590 [Klenkia taihuensis]|nr:hypothetical protein GCM10011381_00590 [Klenkia taihuensis]
MTGHDRHLTRPIAAARARGDVGAGVRLAGHVTPDLGYLPTEQLSHDLLHVGDGQGTYGLLVDPQDASHGDRSPDTTGGAHATAAR